jgi:uncharacterized membrane protein YGL010W
MKTLTQWFDEYAVCHQNETNKFIHYICVPTIFFSIVGLFMSIPSSFLTSFLPFNVPFLSNWAFIALVFVSLFYFRLSIALGLQMVVFSFICLIANFYISQYVPLVWFSVTIFVLAWIGQFYGHKIEGKKPSFFKDLQFLLIGPAWVINHVFSK